MSQIFPSPYSLCNILFIITIIYIYNTSYIFIFSRLKQKLFNNTLSSIFIYIKTILILFSILEYSNVTFTNNFNILVFLKLNIKKFFYFRDILV